MSQGEIYNFLKKNSNKIFTSKDIYLKFQKTPKAISRALSSMRQFNMINYKLIPQGGKIRTKYYLYWYKECE